MEITIYKLMPEYYFNNSAEEKGFEIRGTSRLEITISRYPDSGYVCFYFAIQLFGFGFVINTLKELK